MLPQKKYIKKVIVTDPSSAPEARAERLRRVRNMANLKRGPMCNDPSLNINTYKGWEIARYGGLPADGAEKVVNRVKLEGVVCTVEWLLHGTGIGPYIVPDYQKPHYVAEKAAPSIYLDQNEQYLQNEIALFKEQFPGAIVYEIEDDGLAPYYQPKDIVAGIPLYQEKIAAVVGENCIVQTETGSLLTRHLKQGDAPNKYTLVCTNVQSSVKKPILYDATLISAASIIRHYKRPKP